MDGDEAARPRRRTNSSPNPWTTPLSAVIEQIPSGIVVVDVDGHVTLMNEAGRRMVGMPDPTRPLADQAAEYGLHDSRTGRPLAPGDTPISRALAGESVVTFEDTFLEPGTGQRRWIHGSAAPLRDEMGRVSGAVAVFSDATREHELARDLATSEERLRTVVMHAPVILFALDRDGTIMLAEGPGVARLGFTPQHVVGRSVFDLFPPTHPFIEHVRRAFAGEAFTVTNRESGLMFETRYSPVRDETGSVERVIGVAVDLTERVAVEEALRTSEARFRALSEQATDLITILDAAGTIRYVSPSYERGLGYVPENMLGISAFDFVHPDDAGRARQVFAQLLARSDLIATVTVRMRHADGSWRTVEFVGKNRLHDPAVEGLIVTGRDVTDRTRAEAALRHQALHDALTGLPNRTLLQDRLEQAIHAAQRDGRALTLLLLDLDRFKDVNDTFGHHHGDLLLQQVAERLRAPLRVTDTVARLGGDEFAVLLPGDDRAGAIITAGKIDAALAAPIVIDDHPVHVTASSGIALYPEHGTDAGTLVRRADVAMYVAKRRGVSYALYAPEQDAHASDRLALTEDLRRAITHGELVLYYQPKLDLVTGQAQRVEALLRWQHPLRGLMPPDVFIPLAEETGIITPLTAWVLAAALRQCQIWRQAGLPINVNINLSAANLHDRQLVETVAGLLAAHEIAPGGLGLELTESAIIADMAQTEAVLTRLNALGVRIAIDDFGTGYSSLAYLKHLPVDEIKIDRSFVQHMMQNETDATIVASTIGLGHSLGLRVVAEGVEDAETLQRLASMECDAAQGYYLSRPLPAADLERWLHERPLWPDPESSPRRHSGIHHGDTEATRRA